MTNTLTIGLQLLLLLWANTKTYGQRGMEIIILTTKDKYDLCEIYSSLLLITYLTVSRWLELSNVQSMHTQISARIVITPEIDRKLTKSIRLAIPTDFCYCLYTWWLPNLVDSVRNTSYTVLLIKLSKTFCSAGSSNRNMWFDW